MAEQQKTSDQSVSDEFWEGFGVLLVGLVAAALFALPAIIGLGVWWQARGKLRRFEYALVGLTSVVGLVVLGDGPQGVAAYGKWIWTLGPGAGNPFDVPWLGLLALSAFVFAVAGVITGTKVMAHIPVVGAAFREKVGADESLVPTDKEKKKLQVVKPPAEQLSMAAKEHNLDEQVEFGKRNIVLGVDRHGSPMGLTEKEIGTHGVILGATGSGKSVTIMTFASGLMDLGWDVCLLDLKEDTQDEGLRDFCRNYVTHHPVPYQEMALSDPNSRNWFNVLKGLGRDEARDAILSLVEFDDEHWQNINKRMLTQAINLVANAHQIDPDKFPELTMYEVGRVLSQPSLPSATREMRAALKTNMPGYNEDDYATLSDPSQDEKKSARGFGAKLTGMYETEAGRRALLPRDADHEALDVTADGLMYIGLNTLGLPDLSKVVSSAVLTRLAALAGQLSTGGGGEGVVKKPRALIVDEANWVDRRIIQNLLARARSAGIAVFLCTQGPKDWEDERAATGWDALTQNINCAVIMAQNNPESAIMCADYLGTTMKERITQRFQDDEIIEGVGSISQQEDYIVSPEQLRGLQVGEAILRVGKPEQRMGWMSIAMRDARALPPQVNKHKKWF